MQIQERDEGLLNFLSPAIIIIIGLLVLSIGALSLIMFHFFVPVIIPDPIMASIQMNLVGQIIGIILTLFFLIPYFKLQKVATRTPTVFRTLKVLGVACFALTVAMGLALVLFLVTAALGIPIEHSYGDIILGPQHLSNPWNIALFFATATVGAAVFEELIFRRMLIPSLQQRGMAPTAAVITSSLGFALIHVPNDLINGSPGYVVTHFITTFTIGLMLGLVYVFTQNVIYPMIIHGFINAVAFTELILISINDLNLLLIYSAILLILLFIGIIVGALALFFYFRDPPQRWVLTLKVKSRINIIPGLIGYLIVALSLVSIQVLVEMGVAYAFSPNGFLIYTILIAFYVVYFFILLYIVSITRYESSFEVKPLQTPLSDEAEDVTLEPPQE
ncbi:MAG: lysostaphin resistance A-like protein [Promethearchaeota archaeon]